MWQIKKIVYHCRFIRIHNWLLQSTCWSQNSISFKLGLRKLTQLSYNSLLFWVCYHSANYLPKCSLDIWFSYHFKYLLEYNIYLFIMFAMLSQTTRTTESHNCFRILYYFHKNLSNHIRAKVAPPRLNGDRVGVFGTRSPHRPCPIGLSLVQIDRIQGRLVL